MKCLYCGREFKQEQFECICPACTEQERQWIQEEIAREEESKKAIPRDENGNFILTCGTCGKTYSTVTLEGPQVCFECKQKSQKKIEEESKKRKEEDQKLIDAAEYAAHGE